MPKIEFEQVYNQHYQTIFNYCIRRTGDFDVSRDLTSETFLKAFLNFHKFKWKGIPVRNWLYRIAGNEIKLYHRSRKYQANLIKKIYQDRLFYSTDSLESERNRAQHELEQNQRFTEIQSAVLQLPHRYQEVISLKHFEQLTIAEISTILGKKEGTVKSLLSRGMAKLRTML